MPAWVFDVGHSFAPGLIRGLDQNRHIPRPKFLDRLVHVIGVDAQLELPTRSSPGWSVTSICSPSTERCWVSRTPSNSTTSSGSCGSTLTATQSRVIYWIASGRRIILRHA